MEKRKLTPEEEKIIGRILFWGGLILVIIFTQAVDFIANLFGA